jgi:hypothetical protein
VEQAAWILQLSESQRLYLKCFDSFSPCA